ncbi:MAG TPA: alpha/beta hydrolase [Nocardioides sp.]|nr:alpha/beta hydrolase [Nocardioides sp.]
MRTTIVAGLASCLLLAGCMDSGGSGGSGGSAQPTPAPATHGSTSTGAGLGALGAYYQQKLDWSSCGDDECASLSVPVDYAHPGKASVSLHVEKAPATSGKPIGALVVNPGGPGAPGDYLASDAKHYFAPPLRAAYDIVAFDPRGTGKSDPVDCLTDRQVDDFVAENPEPSTPAEIKAYVAEGRTFWKGCQQRSDALISHVSTVDAARDIDILRAALGQDKLDYLGFSYGTKLGATYAELFSKKVGRMVLDGAEDVALTTRQSALHQAAGFETALRSYVGNCVAKGNCFLGSTVDAGLARISGLLASIEKNPLPTKSSRDLTVGNAFYGVIAPLYQRSEWSYLDAGLQQALQGDGTILMLLSDTYSSRNNDGTYADNGIEAIGVISCLDDPWAIDPAKVPSQYPAFEKASPTFGKVFAWGLTSCWGDPFRNTDRPGIVVDGAGAPPIVVIGTTRDPATPYEEAVALAKELRSGVLISRDGDGHTGYDKGNSCVDDAVHSYLIDGRVPQDGLSC